MNYALHQDEVSLSWLWDVWGGLPVFRIGGESPESSSEILFAACGRCKKGMRILADVGVVLEEESSRGRQL